MKKLTFTLLATVCSFSLLASHPSDTTIVLENRKIEIIDEQNRLRVRVFDLIERGEYVERQLTFEGHYRDGVRHERRHISGTISVPAAIPERRTHRAPHFRPRWRGTGIGFNHFANDDFSLNAMRSMEFTVNFYDKALPFSRNFGLVTGAGLAWNRYHLNNNMVFANVGGVTEVIPAKEGIDLTRSRLGINSITIPLLLEWHIRTRHNRRNCVYFSAGAIGNLNYMSRTRVHYNNADGQRVRESIRGRDLNVRPLSVDLMAQMGVCGFGAVYVKYRPMGLFEGNRGPVINPISVGIVMRGLGLNF